MALFATTVRNYETNRLQTISVYEIPGDLFQVPTGYVWIFTARLVTGEGLPPMAQEWAIGFAALFAILTGVRIYSADKSWQVYVPGGIAVAVGMYFPVLSQARPMPQDGFLQSCPRNVQRPVVHSGQNIRWPPGLVVEVDYAVGGNPVDCSGVGTLSPPGMNHPSTTNISLQGFILGEGFLSIVNLIMQSLGVPTL